jgi:hypothetical protein
MRHVLHSVVKLPARNGFLSIQLLSILFLGNCVSLSLAPFRSDHLIFLQMSSYRFGILLIGVAMLP